MYLLYKTFLKEKKKSYLLLDESLLPGNKSAYFQRNF